jgi:hypothetical protein
MAADTAPEPWRSFLADIDAVSPSAIEMHCIGGFAVTLHYNLSRPTGDIDVWHVIPRGAAKWLTSIGGKGSDLHKKHAVHLQIAAVATLPELYADRLSQVFVGEFENLRIMIVDPYDLALSKLERNSEVDIEDVKHLARVAKFDPRVLAERYRTELRPFLSGPVSRHDLTLQLWLDALAEERGM